LREIIEQQLARTKELEKSTGRIIRWLFHRQIVAQPNGKTPSLIGVKYRVE